MAIVNNVAKTGVPVYDVADMRFVDYSTGDTNLLDPHINTVNTGCGTEIIGAFPVSDDRSTPTVTVDFKDLVIDLTPPQNP